jgi:hypothetical protein
MCCFFLILIFLGPRVGFLIWWFVPLGRAQVNLAFNTIVGPIVGVIFAPWTTLIYTVVYGSNGIVGIDWLWLALGVAADIATYSGSAYKRKSVPGYPTTAP